MKKFAVLVTLVCAMCALTLSADHIDGKWTTETKMPAGKKGGEGRVIPTTITLKSDGDKLTGTVEMSMGGQSRTADIKDGKIDGEKFSFSTVQKGPQGETTVMWEGTVSGDELKGTRKREGADGSMPFSAKKGQ